MSKHLQNKAYVTAHYPQAYAARRNGRRPIKDWCIHIPRISDVTGNVTWRFYGGSAKLAWRVAAESIENMLRRRVRGGAHER